MQKLLVVFSVFCRFRLWRGIGISVGRKPTNTYEHRHMCADTHTETHTHHSLVEKEFVSVKCKIHEPVIILIMRYRQYERTAAETTPPLC